MSEPGRTAAPRSAQRPDDDTRAALLAAAHDLLASEGPSALTVRRIAAAAGVSTMNVYSRFGGKDGVIEELYVDGFTRMRREMADAPVTDDPIDDLRRCGQAYRRFARENPTYYSLMFDQAVPDFVPSDHAMERALAALGGVAERVQRAIDDDLIGGADAFTIAVAFWACDHGLSSLEAKTQAFGQRVFDWDRIAGVAIEAMLAGLARQS